MGWGWGKPKPKQWGWEEDINVNNIYSTWYIFSIYENLRKKKNKALSCVSRGLSFLIPHPKRPSCFPLHLIPSTPPRYSTSVRILVHRIPDHLAMALPTQTLHCRPHAASHWHSDCFRMPIRQPQPDYAPRSYFLLAQWLDQLGPQQPSNLLHHPIDCSHILSKKVWTSPLGRGPSSKLLFPWIVSFSQRLSITVLCTLL